MPSIVGTWRVRITILLAWACAFVLHGGCRHSAGSFGGVGQGLAFCRTAVSQAPT